MFKDDRLIVLVLILLLLGDVGFSFYQYLQMPLDGDLADIVLPSDRCDEVLADPLGLTALFEGEVYTSPNRWVVHALLSNYMRSMPLMLQVFWAPIPSIYLSAALLKVLTHLLLLFVAGLYLDLLGISKKIYLLVSLLILSSFFQAVGYHSSMGMIDQSLSYASFYALPLGIFLLYLYPFFRILPSEDSSSWPVGIYLVMIPLALVQSLGGPLIAPLAVLLCGGMWGYLWLSSYHNNSYDGESKLVGRLWRAMGDISQPIRIIFPIFVIFSLYSIYLGRFNIENEVEGPGLWERYLLLPRGIFSMMTAKPGPWLLLLLTLVQWIGLGRMGKLQGPIKRLLIGAGLLTLVYLLILPLGGYREYRPLIVRRDTFMPIYLLLMFFNIYSLGLLLKLSSPVFRPWICCLGLGIGLFFSLADAQAPPKNSCEIASMKELQEKTSPVALSRECSLMSWKPIKNPGESAPQAKLLLHWGVTEEAKYYFHP